MEYNLLLLVFADEENLLNILFEAFHAANL